MLVNNVLTWETAKEVTEDREKWKSLATSMPMCRGTEMGKRGERYLVC